MAFLLGNCPTTIFIRYYAVLPLFYLKDSIGYFLPENDILSFFLNFSVHRNSKRIFKRKENVPVPHRKAPTEAGAETGANSLPAGEPHRTSRPVLGLFFLSRRSRLGPTSILLPPPKNNRTTLTGPSCYFFIQRGIRTEDPSGAARH